MNGRKNSLAKNEKWRRREREECAPWDKNDAHSDAGEDVVEYSD